MIKRCPVCEEKVYLESLHKEKSCSYCGSALYMEGYETSMALAMVIPGAISMISILFMDPVATVILMAASFIVTVTFVCRYVVKVGVAKHEIHRD